MPLQALLTRYSLMNAEDVPKFAWTNTETTIQVLLLLSRQMCLNRFLLGVPPEI